MKFTWKRSLIAIAFAATILVADIGMGLDLGSLFSPDRVPDRDDVAVESVDAVERTWEGGGSHLAFADTMSSFQADYLEAMNPLPGDTAFDYYGGAIPQIDATETFGLWGPERWRHEWWRWGEESFRDLEEGRQEDRLWWQDDDTGTLRFSDAHDDGLLVGMYPTRAFSAVVSPVVDLRDVEPITRDTEEEAEYRLDSPETPIVSPQDLRQAVRNSTGQTGVVELGDRFVTTDIPAAHNASAALRLKHLYDFHADSSGLRDGARVEVSRYDPVRGWQDWEGLVPSHNKLRLGEDEFEGRYAGPLQTTESNIGLTSSAMFHSQSEGGNVSVEAGGFAVDSGVSVNADEGGVSVSPSENNIGQNLTARPWLYQGEVRASSTHDDLRGPWVGFGDRSGGLVESVFDLSGHAGHMVRFRFVTATLGEEEFPAQGLGWLLEQMEVHALADTGVSVLAPVTPTNGALLGGDHWDARPVVALQNTGPNEKQVLVDLGIEGRNKVTERVTLPPGPWGRVFVSSPETLTGLGLEQPGLHHLSVNVREVVDSDEVELKAHSPLPLDEKRFHFLNVEPEGWLEDTQGKWRAVRVETEAIPFPPGEEEDDYDPTTRLIERGQKLRVHVDVENLGPEPIELEFINDTQSDLWPLLQNSQGGRVGVFHIDDSHQTIRLPPSRDASGSLGEPDAVKRVTWEWQGTDLAQLLDLRVEDRAGDRVLAGGGVRVETMQPNALHVDFSNRWIYDAVEGCERRLVHERNALACAWDSNITSPASPVATTDLRRGVEAHLVVVHRGGAGNVTLETSDSAPRSSIPPADAVWQEQGSREIGSSSRWETTSFSVHNFDERWAGWIRVDIAGNDTQEFVVDEVRVEVGPEERRMPLLWHTFAGDLLPETSGTIRASGDHVAVLHGSAVRASDQFSEDDYDDLEEHHPVNILREHGVMGGSGRETLCWPFECEYENDQLTASVGLVAQFGLEVDTVAPGVSYLLLPRSYMLGGARPTLTFDHWMGPSVSAEGRVEVARVDTASMSGSNDDIGLAAAWDTVATFQAPRFAMDAALQPVEVALGDYTGEEVMIRFRYGYDAALQPGIAPKGWVLDKVSLRQTGPGGLEVLQPSSGNFTNDGYGGFRVDFEKEVEGLRRSIPEVLTTETAMDVFTSRGMADHRAEDLINLAVRDTWVHFRLGDENVPICADLNHPNTRPVGQSVITDPVDLRALVNPVLELEHGGRIARDSPGGMAVDHHEGLPSLRAPGTKIMDLEWQELGPDGRWGEWQRATPFHPWTEVPPASPDHWGAQDSRNESEAGLIDLRTGDRMQAPFTSGSWTGNRVGEDGVTQFNLWDGGPAGQIARFRFIVWEEWFGTPGNAYTGTGNQACNGGTESRNFQWMLYSMRIFEDRHVFDASVDMEDNIRVAPDQRALVDELVPGRFELADDELVVSGDAGGGTLRVEVDVANLGELRHVANVTLDLLDDEGRSVDVPIRFVAGGTPFDRPYGSLPLPAVEGANLGTVQFRVDIGQGQLVPGEYTFRAAVDLDDAPDTNPGNDVVERPLRVVPLRALDFDPGLSVEPAAGTPEQDRELHLLLRNRGNVEERNVTVKARVVELVGFGNEAEVATGARYDLEPRTIRNMGPGSSHRLTWDFVEHVDASAAGLDISTLLQPGTRYAVNVTIHPAEDSVRSWWDNEHGERFPLLPGTGEEEGALIDIVDPPGERCGCYHVPFIVEDLIAGSDLTPAGTTDVLQWSDAQTVDDIVNQWETITRYRLDGRMVEREDGDDLPTWQLVDAVHADEHLGTSGVQGAAWHLPAHDGFERLEHELISPPLPAHVIDGVSRGILDLRYLSELDEGQARLEVRSLEPGGTWGEWGNVDDVRMQRVAIVLPPDFPRVISGEFSQALDNASRYPATPTEGHPIPPFYKKVEDGEIDYGNRSEYFFFNQQWSPFPLFHEDPGHERNLQSVRGLAMVLQRLADDPRVGPDNVAVFTTFPESQDADLCFDSDQLNGGTGWWETSWWKECFGEFGIPPHRFEELGIEFGVEPRPLFRVASDLEDIDEHSITVQNMTGLGQRIDSYGSMLLMGDGLTRWAASEQERSTVLSNTLSPSHPDKPEVFSWEKQPVGDYGTPELERHFDELRPALRLAPTEGIRVIAATGPATASVGFSNVAEGVPLSFWIPPNTQDGGQVGGIMMPSQNRCVVDIKPDPTSNDPTSFEMNVTIQPKQQCRFPGNMATTPSVPARDHVNYQYVSAPDAQTTVLRELLTRGGSQPSYDAVRAGQSIFGVTVPMNCGRTPSGEVSYNCVIPHPWTVQQSLNNGVTFITAPFARNETAGHWTIENTNQILWPDGRFSPTDDVITWVDRILENLQSSRYLPAGTGGWEHLPMDRGAPMGGVFVRDSDGRDRFVGETVQFRISVQSALDAGSPGHGSFLLDSFQLLGTPSEQAEPAVRVVQPRDDERRAPGERDFHLAVEVINRGRGAMDAGAIDMGMEQVPGRGDCGGHCIVNAFHPNVGGPVNETIDFGGLPGGARHIITLGGPLDRPLASTIPDDVALHQVVPQNLDNRMPGVQFPADLDEDARFALFDVTARFLQDPANSDRVTLNATRVIRDLVKDPLEDIRISPNQAMRGATSGGGTMPGTDYVHVDVQLTNDGSRLRQNGRIGVVVAQALMHDCYDNNPDLHPQLFRHCDGERTFVGSTADDIHVVWAGSQEVVVPRGETVSRGLDIPVDGLEPGVYEVIVTVDTIVLGDAFHTSERTTWVYLGDPDDPTGSQWAVHVDELAGITMTSDLNRQFPPTNSQPDLPPWFVMGGSDVCQQDPTTTSSTQPNGGGNFLRHGWAFSSDANHQCADLFLGSGSLQWVRDASPSTTPETQRQTVPNTQQQDWSPNQAGLGDFGPDFLVWYPGHDVSPSGNVRHDGSRGPFGVAPTLADFAAGDASLVIDTRFQATQHTGYVVEMQVPQRQCNQDEGSTQVCNWVWNWDNSGMQAHWFPLTPVGIDSDDGVDFGTNQDPGQPDCRSVGGQTPPGRACFRNAPTNPNAGQPGIWGMDSTDMPGNNDGWVSLRYPIDPDFQDGLVDNYCDSNDGLSQGDVSNIWGNHDGFRRCMYTAAAIGVSNEIPRPVAFRFNAASFGGDQGLNFWDIRGVSLTAHELSLNRDRFAVSLDDGDSRVVPVEVRNEAAVDDMVEVSVAMQESVDGVSLGVRHSGVQAFEESMQLRIPAGQARTVWVNVSAEFGTFTQADVYRLPDVTVTARSLIAELVSLEAVLDVELNVRERADLAIGEMIVNNVATDRVIEASEGTPVHVSLELRNEGLLEITDPVLVRLWAQERDPVTGELVCDEGQKTCRQVVEEEIVTQGLLPRCRGQEHCVVVVNMDWTPEHRGLFELVAEVNLPGPEDDLKQVPEAVFGNNVETRRVNVGAVPLADLHVNDVRLVPFDDGCAHRNEAVARLIDGHQYCVVARVANEGSQVAMHPTIEFSIGAADAFSRGQDWSLEQFPPESEQWVTSSPLRAMRPPTAAGEMEFRVEVDTQSLVASVSGMEKRVRVPVDDYEMEMRSSELPPIMIGKGGQTTLTMDLKNAGTAVTTPVVRVEEPHGLRFSLVQPPPLQPGESAIVTLDVRAGFAAAEGPREVDLVLSTAQDPLVRVPVPLQVTVVEGSPADATLLALDTVPAKTMIDVVADNTGWSINGTWTPIEASGALRLVAPGEPLEVDRHDVGVHAIPVEVPPHTPPGAYNGTIRFEVAHGPLASLLEVPYALQVQPAPGLEAELVTDHAVTVRGVDANVTIRLTNTGNQPVEAVVSSQVDHGVIPDNETVLLIEPGEREELDLRVRPGAASRSLGETLVRWRVVDEDPWQTPQEPMMWTVRHLPAGVRLDATNLDQVEPRMGRTETIRATLLNPGNEPVEAEAALVADGQMHSRRIVELQPGAIEVVELMFRLDEPGEHLLQVLVRPAGSQVTLEDAVFHDVGDAHTRELTLTSEDGRDGDASAMPVPAAGIAVLLAALLAALVVATRRRAREGTRGWDA